MAGTDRRCDVRAGFGVEFAGQFAPGARITGRITHEGYEHLPFHITVERMEPERLVAIERYLSGSA